MAAQVVVPMSEGFKRMATMKGTLASNFEASFNLRFPGSKTTFHENKAVWDAASKELRKEYIRAGYTNRGLWKDFRKEVQSQYPEWQGSRKALR